MTIKKIMEKIWNKPAYKYWKFVAENDKKCCSVCKEFDGVVFRDDDPNIPKLPLHPNCRCILVQEE